MDAHTIEQNMLGTAYNVLFEQQHPDLEVFAEIIRNRQPADTAFDLRYRRASGDKFITKVE